LLFESKRVAHGYARHRPQFQTDVVRHIREDLGLSRPLEAALDVGCGTGLSTVPLLGLAASVVGADPSYAMIVEAQPQSSVHYCVATAEALPFASKSFDLITVSGAYDWIDADLFLPAAQHLLREGGWLVIYDGGETGVMVDKPSFKTWYQGSYLSRYPKPSRRKPTMSSAFAKSNGFVFERLRNYTVDIPFTLEAYIDFAMTQSMITFAIERGQEDLISISNWLRRACTPFFLSHSETVVFEGYIWYLRNGT
jgi:ubiquinone/menaquinone biosynthesis C-methylase UbiE